MKTSLRALLTFYFTRDHDHHSLIEPIHCLSWQSPMKRSSSAHTLDSPPKKQKRSPSESESETSSTENDQKWVKVEKRKSKKAKKLDAKFDVCVSHSPPAYIPLTLHRRLLHDFYMSIKRSSSAKIPLASTYDVLSVVFSRICVLTLRLGCSRPCPSYYSRFTATELD